MRVKRKYLVPEVECVMLGSKGMVMQETTENTFSGGDPKTTGIVIDKEGDNSYSDNLTNQWSSHLWDTEEAN